jgi:hypothetical protein
MQLVKLSLILLVLFTLHPLAVNAESGTSTFIRLTTTFNDTTESTKFGLNTRASMLDVLTYDDVASGESHCETGTCFLVEAITSERMLCVSGPITMDACKILSKLSKVSNRDYDRGLHELVSLQQCQVSGDGSQIVATLEARHDWEQKVLQGNLRLAKCID